MYRNTIEMQFSELIKKFRFCVITNPIKAKDIEQVVHIIGIL